MAMAGITAKGGVCLTLDDGYKDTMGSGAGSVCFRDMPRDGDEDWKVGNGDEKT